MPINRLFFARLQKNNRKIILLSSRNFFHGKRQKPCQMDLLIQCRHTVYICEIKFGQKISRDILDEVSEKIRRLPLPKGISIRPVLIYQGELSPQIAQADFFTHLISFDQFLA